MRSMSSHGPLQRSKRESTCTCGAGDKGNAGSSRIAGKVWGFLPAVIAALILLPMSARGGPHLAEGIRLYNDGLLNEALTELRAELELDPHAPAAYYYAAKIRIEKGQLSRALDNVDAALRDSSGYTDALALRAHILLKNGRDEEALAVWKRFVALAGAMEEEMVVTAGSIVAPEEYRRKLARDRERRESERLEAERLQREIEEREQSQRRAATEAVPPDPGTPEQTAPESEPKPEPVDPVALADDSEPEVTAVQPLDDLENRVRSQIRRGMYGLLAFFLAAGAIAAGAWYMMRRRKRRAEELDFSEEVGRILLDTDVADLDEKSALSEFEAKKLELLGAINPETEPAVPPESTPYDLAPPESEQLPEAVTAESSVEAIRDSFAASNAGGGPQPITEEVKTLVSRLYREGGTPEDIARTADLTVTEVKLILAVREHHTSVLVEDITGESHNEPDRDRLIHAVHDLSAEGLSTREIARTLSISTSEVQLASMVITMRKKTLRG